jgi:hypothetical protein
VKKKYLEYKNKQEEEEEEEAVKGEREELYYRRVRRPVRCILFSLSFVCRVMAGRQAAASLPHTSKT